LGYDPSRCQGVHVADGLQPGGCDWNNLAELLLQLTDEPNTLQRPSSDLIQCIQLRSFDLGYRDGSCDRNFSCLANAGELAALAR